jgi:hypothetical protein
VSSDPTATPTPFDDIAAQVTAGIDAVVKLIPAFEPRHAETAAFVQRYQTFSDESIRSTIAAIEANPELNLSNKFDLQEAKSALQFLDAFRPVIDQADEFRSNLRFTYFARKARVVAQVLQTYAIAKGIGRDPSSAGVAAHAKIIKRDLRRPRVARNKAAKKTAPAPTPAPAPVPPQTPKQ